MQTHINPDGFFRSSSIWTCRKNVIPVPETDLWQLLSLPILKGNCLILTCYAAYNEAINKAHLFNQGPM